MTIITIPKHLAHKDLVLIPRKEYEALKRVQSAGPFKEVAMTKAQKMALVRARKNLALGNTLNLDEFKRKLGLTR